MEWAACSRSIAQAARVERIRHGGIGGRSMLVTTANEIEGHRVTQYLGLVRGITVRSRSVIGNIGAGIQSLFGGNISSSPRRRARRPGAANPKFA
jgi:hypothetical protein